MRKILLMGFPAGAVPLLILVAVSGRPDGHPSESPGRRALRAADPAPTAIRRRREGTRHEMSSEPRVRQTRSTRTVQSHSKLSALIKRNAARGKLLPLSALLGLLRRFGDSREMLDSFRSQVTAWLGSSDASIRRKAEVLLAEIDQGWEKAALYHSNPEVRRVLLARPPDGSRNKAVILLSVARTDPLPEVRAAALAGLPAGLDAMATKELIHFLDDSNPKAARSAVIAMGMARILHADARDVLRALALSADEPAGLRREARRAILRHRDSLSQEDLAIFEGISD